MIAIPTLCRAVRLGKPNIEEHTILGSHIVGEARSTKSQWSMLAAVSRLRAVSIRNMGV